MAHISDPAHQLSQVHLILLFFQMILWWPRLFGLLGWLLVFVFCVADAQWVWSGHRVLRRPGPSVPSTNKSASHLFHEEKKRGNSAHYSPHYLSLLFLLPYTHAHMPTLVTYWLPHLIAFWQFLLVSNKYFLSRSRQYYRHKSAEYSRTLLRAINYVINLNLASISSP